MLKWIKPTALLALPIKVIVAFDKLYPKKRKLQVTIPVLVLDLVDSEVTFINFMWWLIAPSVHCVSRDWPNGSILKAMMAELFVPDAVQQWPNVFRFLPGCFDYNIFRLLSQNLPYAPGSSVSFWCGNMQGNWNRRRTAGSPLWPKPYVHSLKSYVERKGGKCGKVGFTNLNHFLVWLWSRQRAWGSVPIPIDLHVAASKGAGNTSKPIQSRLFVYENN